MASGDQRIFGERWRVTGILASSAMAHVLAGEEIATGRRVAIKVARRRDDGGAAMALLRRESVALGRVRSPQLPELLAAGDDGDDAFLVMAMLDGASLSLEEKRTFAEVAQTIAAIAEPLEVLHAAGLVHCDVKPANLMRSDGKWVLIDLNSALAIGATTGGQFAGSWPYMAPELWQGAPVSPATDVYALASLAVVLATGAPLFDASTAIQWMRAHLDRDPPSLASRGIGVAPPVEAAIAAALAKDPGARPARARDFARALSP
jgi:serine/threonine-protein kinase